MSLYCPEFGTPCGLLVAVTKVLPLIFPWLISESCPAVAARFTLGLFKRRKDWQSIWSSPGISQTLLSDKIIRNCCLYLSSCMELPPVTHQKWSLELCKGLFRRSVYEGSLLRLLGCPQADLCSLQEGYGSEDVRVSVSLQWVQGGSLLYWAITCKGWFERPSYHPVFTAGHGLPH